MGKTGTLFFDSSALVKRYALEVGTQMVNQIFTKASSSLKLASTLVQYAETYSILMRKRNGGRLDTRLFAKAIATIQTELLMNENFPLFSVDDECYLKGLDLVQKHNLNTVDSACLFCHLRYLQETGEKGFFVVSDRRLFRAAQSESLECFDPETMDEEELKRFLIQAGSPT
jgi:predicted nucleic acid-binding protein